MDGSKTRKRVITEARKEQNRIAQQQYRQRLKDRVQNPKPMRPGHLAALPGQLLPLRAKGVVPETPAQLLTVSSEHLSEDVQSHGSDYRLAETPGQSEPTLFEDCFTNTTELVPGNMLNFDAALPLSTFSGVMAPGVDADLAIDGSDNWNIFDTLDVDQETQTLDEVSISNMIEASLLYQQSPSMLGFENWLQSRDSSLTSESHSGFRGDIHPPSTFIQSLSANTQIYAPSGLRDALLSTLSSQLPGIQDLAEATSKFLREHLHQVQISYPGNHSLLYNLYINYLQCTETTTLLAYLHNAPCIGLNSRALLNGCNQSPFYRPSTTTTDDPQYLLAAARKPWIPAQLQPTLAQIIFPHLSYLDLLPFPTMRERAISLAATAPQLFQPLDLKTDILRGGLCCSRNSKEISGRQPWDSGSWEMAPWFLKKWRLLIG